MNTFKRILLGIGLILFFGCSQTSSPTDAERWANLLDSFPIPHQRSFAMSDSMHKQVAFDRKGWYDSMKADRQPILDSVAHSHDYAFLSIQKMPYGLTGLTIMSEGNPETNVHIDLLIFDSLKKIKSEVLMASRGSFDGDGPRYSVTTYLASLDTFFRLSINAYSLGYDNVKREPFTLKNYLIDSLITRIVIHPSGTVTQAEVYTSRIAEQYMDEEKHIDQRTVRRKNVKRKITGQLPDIWR